MKLSKKKALLGALLIGVVGAIGTKAANLRQGFDYSYTNSAGTCVNITGDASCQSGSTQCTITTHAGGGNHVHNLKLGKGCPNVNAMHN